MAMTVRAFVPTYVNTYTTVLVRTQQKTVYSDDGFDFDFRTQSYGGYGGDESMPPSDPLVFNGFLAFSDPIQPGLFTSLALYFPAVAFSSYDGDGNSPASAGSVTLTLLFEPFDVLNLTWANQPSIPATNPNIMVPVGNGGGSLETIASTNVNGLFLFDLSKVTQTIYGLALSSKLDSGQLTTVSADLSGGTFDSGGFFLTRYPPKSFQALYRESVANGSTPGQVEERIYLSPASMSWLAAAYARQAFLPTIVDVGNSSYLSTDWTPNEAGGYIHITLFNGFTEPKTQIIPTGTIWVER